MRTITLRRISVLVLLLTSVPFAQADEFCDQEYDEFGGLNGSFETVQNNLPVNWLLYTPKTVPDAEFDLWIDVSDAVHGTNSLRFVVDDCKDTGSWESPGMAQELTVVPGQWYRISFWVKNVDTYFQARVSGYDPELGEVETVIGSGEIFEIWEQLEFDFYADESFESAFFEISLLAPGEFWIDAVSVNPVLEDEAAQADVLTADDTEYSDESTMVVCPHGVDSRYYPHCYYCHAPYPTCRYYTTSGVVIIASTRIIRRPYDPWFPHLPRYVRHPAPVRHVVRPPGHRVVRHPGHRSHTVHQSTRDHQPEQGGSRGKQQKQNPGGGRQSGHGSQQQQGQEKPGNQRQSR